MRKFFYWVAEQPPINDLGEYRYDPKEIDYLYGQTRQLARKLRGDSKFLRIHKFDRNPPFNYLGVVS